MSVNDSREIVIVMFQYSVIIKGIERKLTEMQYRVSTVTENLENEMKRIAGRVSLIVFYLPPDINEDHSKLKTLLEMGDVVEKRHQNAILIGEGKYKAEVMRQIPTLRSRPWLDRPVDMDTLEQTVIQEVNRVDAPDKKGRILIVDDDPAYAKIVREWIKEEYKVDIVTAGMQAISFLIKIPENEKVDLILLDYEMPVVDGPQVLQMLRQEEATANIPVIFLTGNGTREAVSRVMELKPDGYLLKSTKKEDLLEFLNSKIKKN